MASRVVFSRDSHAIAANEVHGSILYEDFDTNELKLNFYKAEIDIVQTHPPIAQYESPQMPLGQSWIVEYPLLAYKTCTPDNQEIAILHLACDMPQRFIHLGGWEFVCFVHHCQMQDINIYEEQYESTCDIMFLVRRDGMIRLMSYKSNPWDYEKDQDGLTDKGIFNVKSNVIYLFSGVVGWQKPEQSGRLKARDTTSSRIQTCHLLTLKDSIRTHFALVIQFNDKIVTSWLQSASNDTSSFRELITPGTMIKQKLVRGFNDKIFFAQSTGQEDKVYMLEFHPNKPRHLMRQPIFSLTGSKLVLLTTDFSNCQNDAVRKVRQSLFLLDDKQIVRRLVSNDGASYTVTEEFDLSHHNIK